MKKTVGFDFRAALDVELHDLSQPLASLQCRLEIGRIIGGEEALLEAVDGGLLDLRRLCDALQRMRELAALPATGTEFAA